MKIFGWSLIFGALATIIVYFMGVYLEMDVRNALFPGIAATKLFINAQASDFRFFALLALLIDFLVYSFCFFVPMVLISRLFK